MDICKHQLSKGDHMNESDTETIEILDICCKVTTDWGPRKVLYYLSISTKHRSQSGGISQSQLIEYQHTHKLRHQSKYFIALGQFGSDQYQLQMLLEKGPEQLKRLVTLIGPTWSTKIQRQ